MISVVTVSYKAADYLGGMLESLFAHANGCEFEVFVVTNGDQTDISALETRFPTVRWIKNDRNLGFAGGCNLAINEARGHLVCLVNPDVVFTENALCAIEKKMRRDLDVGIGGISLKNFDGTQQDCVVRFPAPLDQLLILLKIPHLLPNLSIIRRYLMKDFDYSRTQDVDQVMGAFFCIRRDLLRQIGLLDDQFFVWYEEVDYCKRAKDAGWKVRYYADITARHRKGGSFSRITTLKKQATIKRSLRHYMKKHYGIGVWLLFVLLDPVFLLLAIASSIVKPK
jgi:hypothetical protein